MDGAPPVFVIGTGRSGTTALYEFLCSHPDTTWFSNWSQRIPPLALLHPRGTEAGKERPGSRWAFRPVEGYAAFDRAFRLEDGRIVTRSRARERLLQAEVGLHRLRGLRPRPPAFVSKNTRNTRAVPVLDALFPGARFVDLVRDPVATVTSMTRVDFFDTLQVEWDGTPMTVTDAAARGADRVRIAATIWADETSMALDDLARLDADRVVRIRYEDLVEDPRVHLRAVCTFVGLDPARHRGFDRRADELRPRSSGAEPDPALRATVRSVCGPTAARLGYSIDP